MNNFIKNHIELIIYYLLKIILPKHKSRMGKLLLINTGEIGDLVVSSVLLENPKVFDDFDEVDFLIKEQYLELFKNYKGKVNFIGYNYHSYKYSVFYKIKMLTKLRTERYETCIHLTAARGILNEEITHLIGAKNVIAINSFHKYLGNRLGRFFDKKYSAIIAKNILNEYDKHFELMKFLTGLKDFRFNAGITFNENDGETKFADYKNAIVIAPFSSLMNREWKREYYGKLIDELDKNNKLVLLGSGKQKNALEELARGKKNVTVLAGSLQLFEIPFLLKSAKLFIGQDSGVTHIALKMGIPLTAIIGGGEFGRFFPYRESAGVKFLYSKMDCFLCHWECTKDEKYCLTEVKPQAVIEEVMKIL